MAENRRVVITGMGGVTPLGSSWEEILPELRARRNGVVRMDAWDRFSGLDTRLAAPCKAPIGETYGYNRKLTRGMGRVAIFAVRASELALRDAGLIGSPLLISARCGVAYGSCSGSTDAVEPFARMRLESSTRGISATSYIQMMPQTCAVNIGLFFGLQGRVIPTCSACTSGSQAVGYAFESVRAGRCDLMVAGGAEELDPAMAAVFDVMYATSRKNDTPSLSPRPFDKDRDGLVIGEGSTTLVLESLEHALARGAHIHAEILGFGTNSDGVHLTQPSSETMLDAAREALDDARLKPEKIGYVNAHATATELGDIAESEATHRLLGSSVPVASIKGYTGHTLGAAGALESWWTIAMMNQGWFAPSLGLDQVDTRCAPLNYLMGDGLELNTDIVMNNNFAFGGINTSLIFGRWPRG